MTSTVPDRMLAAVYKGDRKVEVEDYPVRTAAHSMMGRGEANSVLRYRVPTPITGKPNLKAVGYVVPPCVLTGLNTCLQLFAQQSLCGSEGGTWWGSGNDGSAPVGQASVYFSRTIVNLSPRRAQNNLSILRQNS